MCGTNDLTSHIYNKCCFGSRYFSLLKVAPYYVDSIHHRYFLCSETLDAMCNPVLDHDLCWGRGLYLYLVCFYNWPHSLQGMGLHRQVAIDDFVVGACCFAPRPEDMISIRNI
ncbi:hypothetical protein Hdeb2414_s0643g00928541 [Helianthus debilis subsp. tardiflorus]